MAFALPPKENKIIEVRPDVAARVGSYFRHIRYGDVQLGRLGVGITPMLIDPSDYQSTGGTKINIGYPAQAYFKFSSNPAADWSITVICYKPAVATKIFKCKTSGANGDATGVANEFLFRRGANVYETAVNLKAAMDLKTTHATKIHIITTVNEVADGSVHMRQATGIYPDSSEHYFGNTAITYSDTSVIADYSSKFVGGKDLEEEGLGGEDEGMYNVIESLVNLNTVNKKETIIYEDVRGVAVQSSYFDSGGARNRLCTPIWSPPNATTDAIGSAYQTSFINSVNHMQLYKDVQKNTGTSANGTKATGVFTFSNTPVVNACITLTDAVGVQKTYRCAADGTGVTVSNGCVTFDEGTGADAAAKAADVAINLKAAIEHANGHNGTIDCTLSTAQITMEQDPVDSMDFSNSNTTITTDSTFDAAVTGTMITAFTGGYTETGNEPFLLIGGAVKQLSIPRTHWRNTYIDRVQANIMAAKDSSILADQSGKKYRLELYGGRTYYTGGDIAHAHPGFDAETIEGGPGDILSGGMQGISYDVLFRLGYSDWHTMTPSSNRYGECFHFQVEKTLVGLNVPYILVIRYQDHADMDLLTGPTTSNLLIKAAMMGGPV